MYQSLLRPLLFRRDAEKIHQDIVKLVASLRRMSPLRPLVRACFDYQGGTPFSWQGLTFRNRVGLSAGFDKGAECFDELADFGFALIEVGTITPAPVAGNPQPRIFRRPRTRLSSAAPDSTIPASKWPPSACNVWAATGSATCWA